MAEHYNVSWQQFTEHLRHLSQQLYQEGEYSDVTLVSDDQTQFKAHKIVLSACSPVFKKIIDNNPSQHPLIYLRGIQSYEMESILQFMYLGEGKFYYERMAEFIKVAKDLEMNDISKGVEMPNKVEDVHKESVLDDEVKETDEYDEPKQTLENKIRQWEPRNQISSDARSKSTSTQCSECGKLFSSKNSLLRHYKSEHEGIKYHCNQCDYQAKTNGNLQIHIQSKHEGIKYDCNQCDYQAKTNGNLHRHIQSIHEGIKYPCNQCDFQATSQFHLQRHIQSKHEGIKYPCNQCDSKLTRRSHLKSHIKAKHSGNIL